MRSFSLHQPDATDLVKRDWCVVPTLDHKHPGVKADAPGLTVEQAEQLAGTRFNVIVGSKDHPNRSGIIDVETDGPIGEAALLAACGGVIPDGPRMMTSSGSIHRVFGWPVVTDGYRVQIGAGLLPKVDVPWQFLALDGEQRIWTGWELEVPQMPAGLTRIVVVPKAQAKAEAAEGVYEGDNGGTPGALQFLAERCDAIRSAVEGTWNDTFHTAVFGVAGLVAAGELDAEYAGDQIAAACEDPDEAQGVFLSSWEAGWAEPWSVDPGGTGTKPPLPQEDREVIMQQREDLKELRRLRARKAAEAAIALEEDSLFIDFPLEETPAYSLSDVLTLPDPEWLINRILTRNAIGVTAAAAGAGKTFWVLDQAIRLAQIERRVLYLALEGLYSMKERVTAWLSCGAAKGPIEAHLLFNSPDWPGLNVREPESVEWYRQQIDALGPFDLVVVDNLNMAGYDDEDNPGAAAVVRCMKTFLNTQGVALVNGSVMAIHNFGWGNKRIRGGSKLRDGMDAQVYMEVVKEAEGDGTGPEGNDELQVTRVWCDKAKRGKPFEPFWFGLKPVGGGDMDSCLVVEAKKPAAEDPNWIKFLANTTGKDNPEDNFITAKEFGGLVGKADRTAAKILNAWLAKGLAERCGGGKAKDPYKYRATPALEENQK